MDNFMIVSNILLIGLAITAFVHQAVKKAEEQEKIYKEKKDDERESKHAIDLIGERIRYQLWEMQAGPSQKPVSRTNGTQCRYCKSISTEGQNCPNCGAPKGS